jgi:subtilisin family serine protease
VNLVNRFLIIAASILIAACGGGGGGGTSSTATSEVSGINESSTCNVTNTSSANEPLFDYIWHIKNTDQYFASTNPAAGSGVDLCMGNLWASGINGNGVKINVVDSGLEIAHEDLVDRIISGASYNFLNASTDPTSTATTGDHGTSVAGLIAATSGNSKGGAGVAPQAGLMGYNYLESDQSNTKLGIAFGANLEFESRNADVMNYSAGSAPSILSSPTESRDTVFLGQTSLRAGKGALFVKSAGNNFLGLDNGGDSIYCNREGISCQNANSDRTNTTYNAIVVASLGADDSKSSYSTTGSALWVSGFGGEYGYDVAVDGSLDSAAAYKPAMLTTDQSTCGIGYSRAGVTKNRLDEGDGSGLHNASCNYTAGFNGTSSAAPTVSGVVALMLQANPELTWRDVRHILASTSRRVNPSSAAITSTTLISGVTLTLEQGWVKNGAGFWYHNWYGFGLVNAAAAVAMAQTYTAASLGTFTSQVFHAVLESATIPSGGLNGLTKTFSVAGPTTVEQAEMTLYFNDSYAPICTQIELSSPRGTKSILLNMGSAHLGASTGGVRFLSNAFYGESAAGTWTLRFIKTDDTDCNSSNLSSTTRQALTIRGRN